jgi:hypothetical protein
VERELRGRVRRQIVPACAVLLAVADLALALPPPVPVEVHVVTSSHPASMAAEHAREIPAALIADNWFAALESAPRPTIESCASAGTGKEACLRAAVSGLQRTKGAPPVVVLSIVPVDTIQSKVTCIGTGSAPSNPEAQSVDISVKRLLYAEAAERHQDRLAVARCILAAASELHDEASK